jgi:hypothetical protein
MLPPQFTCRIALIVAALASAGSPPPALAADEVPTALSCRFDTGTTGTFDKGEFQSSTPAPLAFDLKDIDLDGQRATLVLPDAAQPGTVRIIRALNANHFLEVVQEGFLNLTTIYDRDPATGAYPAVHSRHFGLLGTPVFAQYRGLCRGK